MIERCPHCGEKPEIICGALTCGTIIRVGDDYDLCRAADVEHANYAEWNAYCRDWRESLARSAADQAAREAAVFSEIYGWPV